MSKFSDYITALEGKEDLDPLKIAADLHSIYTDEIGTRDAKIADQDAAIAEKDTVVATKDEEITRWKARNYDLTMQIPSNQHPADKTNENENEIDGATITPDNLFESA
ncbi:MAG TPA: hypothetical protein VN081_02315 [Dongiaceae bacterium]|nr:hypothetical protein [Dongiaceae bacterium]